MITIAFPDANDIIVLVTLEGNQYKLRLLWNDVGEFWTLSVRSETGTPLIEGIRAVPNFPLLQPYHKPNVPPGELMVITSDDSLQDVGRDNFANGKAVLVYVTEAEVNAI